MSTFTNLTLEQKAQLLVLFPPLRRNATGKPYQTIEELKNNMSEYEIEFRYQQFLPLWEAFDAIITKC